MNIADLSGLSIRVMRYTNINDEQVTVVRMLWIFYLMPDILNVL